jgi:hypothetical protein
VFCPNGCYITVPNIKVRPIPELNTSVVFTPDNPNLYSLNQAARLVLAFCDGRLGSGLENAYCAALDPLVGRNEARAELRRTVEDLERKGIVRNTRAQGKASREREQ